MTIETHDAADVIARLKTEIDRLEDFESECRMWRRRAREAIASVRPHINGPYFREAYDGLVNNGHDGALRTEWLRVFTETATALQRTQEDADALSEELAKSNALAAHLFALLLEIESLDPDDDKMSKGEFRGAVRELARRRTQCAIEVNK